MTKQKHRVSKFNMIITMTNLLMLFINIFVFNNDTPSEVPITEAAMGTSITCTTSIPEQVFVGRETLEYMPKVTEPVKEEPRYFIEADQNGALTEASIRSISECVGQETGVSPILLQAIAWGESRYKPDIKSDLGAIGVCQIMPEKHAERLIALGITDLTNPYQNMVASADYIKDIENSKYGHDKNFVIMAYKSGISGATKRYEKGSLTTYVTYINDKIIELEDYYNE